MVLICENKPNMLHFFLLVVAATAADILWLPLGDSITWGCGTDGAPRGSAACAKDAGGYRVPLAWALSQQGHNVPGFNSR